MATNRAHVLRPHADARITGGAATLDFSRVDLNRGEAVFVLRPLDRSEPPEIPVPLSQIRPGTVEDRDEVWKEVVGAMLERFRGEHAYPDFVRGFEVQKGADSTGDPAFYVRILVNPTRGPADDKTVSEWSEFTERLQGALLQLRLQRWPYVQVGEWRGRK